MVVAADFRRNINLDALRAIAILMVLGRHSDSSALWSRAWFKVGWAGVDLFFVLSGFLVSGLLFAGYQERKRIDFSRFYIRRGLKIWPAFYALIITNLVIDLLSPGHSVSTRGLLPEVTFMQSYFEGIWGSTWSLAVEEHFYLTLPVLLLLMIRRGNGRPFASMPYVFGVIAILVLVCRFAVGWKENGTSDFLTYLYPTHLRIDGLMFGVLLSYYNKFRPELFARFAAWRGGWVVIAAAVVLLSAIRVENRNMHTWGLTVIYLAAGCLIAKAVAFEGPAPIRAISGLLANIGVYSYSIYLWHRFYQWRVLEPFHIASHALWFWCYFAGAILFGIAAAKAIEIPVLHFRDRVFPSRSKSGITMNECSPKENLPKAQLDAALID
jgi:peptidoglycan/LPS O-acetylase OafA/YrhL